MNEQLAAIRARREAALSVNPRTAAASSVYSIPVLYATSRYLPKEAIDKAARLAEFVNAAPGDIDTLLAEVERLTVALHDDAATKLGDAVLEASRLRREVAALTAERDERSLVAEQLSMVLHIRDTQLAALTAERDALAQQLQQAQAQLAGDVVEPMLWKAAPPKRHEWDEDATTPA